MLVGKQICDFSILDWFLRFLPRQYIANVLIPETNKSLESTDMPLTFGEFAPKVAWIVVPNVNNPRCT